MRKIHTLFVHLFICSFLYLFLVSSAQAAYVKFDKATTNVAVGATFTLDAIVDAGSDQITSTDMWVLYDPTLLEAQTVASGTFFPVVTNSITAGKIYIAGLITDAGTYKTGSGTVATITFKGLKDGAATASYDCRADVSNSSKVIKNAVDPTNIIVCTQNGTSVVTIGTGAGSATVPTTAAVPTTIYNNQQVNPTALPQTGLMDTMPKLFIAGSLFVMIGVAMRVLLSL